MRAQPPNRMATNPIDHLDPREVTPEMIEQRENAGRHLEDQ